MAAAALRALARLGEPPAVGKGEVAVLAAGRQNEELTPTAANRFLDMFEVGVRLSFCY